MNTLKRLRTNSDYEAALARIDELMGAKLGTPEGDELDVLVDLVEHYENKFLPAMGNPSAIEAIEFRMDQAGLTQRDLVPFIGSRAKVSEVLSGKRQLTMQMARALHEHLGIPANVLLQSDPSPSSLPSNVDYRRFPLSAMANLGWIEGGRDLDDRAEEIVGDLIRRAGGKQVCAALYRKSSGPRSNAKTDPFALKAWCLQALAIANSRGHHARYKPGTVTLQFLKELAQLSWFDDGPKRAQNILERHGLPLIVLPHLPRTYLDGAALKLGGAKPIVALTLRYDRIDNFWFCLLHELGHIGRHMEAASDVAFVDDLSLRDLEGNASDPREKEADEWAEEALIPHDAWNSSAAKIHPSPSNVLNLAKQLQVHPAVVAGRIRHETKNYRLLSHFVGAGEIRRQFWAA